MIWMRVVTFLEIANWNSKGTAIVAIIRQGVYAKKLWHRWKALPFLDVSSPAAVIEVWPFQWQARQMHSIELIASENFTSKAGSAMQHSIWLALPWCDGKDLCELPSGAPGLHALLNYFGINFRFDYTYTYTFNCLEN